MTSAASVSYFLTHEASRMTREAMLDLFNAEFPDYEGNFAFPGLSANGGTLLGDTLVAGGNVTAGSLILLKPSDIYKIGDRGVEVSLSTEAAIQMDDAPDGESDTPTPNSNVVSMFQTESVAIKVVRPLNFAKRRASAVAAISGADYGTPAAAPAG